MSRLITFGCSFTSYRYWTWADILGQQYNEFENYGQSGAGNLYILNSVMEADQRRRFGPDDTVIVCWTNVLREDRYLDDRRGWVTLGNVATSDIFVKEFAKNALQERGSFIRDVAFIKAVKEFLESRGCKWKFLAMCPLTQVDSYDTRTVIAKDVVDLYKDVLDCIPQSFMEVLGYGYWTRDIEKRAKATQSGPGQDYHPTTEEHLLVLDTVLPGWVTNDAVRQKVKESPVVWQKGLAGDCRMPRI